MRQQQTILLLGVFLIVVVGSCLLFVKQRKDFKAVESRYLQTLDERDTYKAKNIELEDEIGYLLDDRAKALAPYQEDFSFQTFGVKSPLLEGKKVEVVPFHYKRQQIVAKSVTLSEVMENTIPISYGITVWQFDGTKCGSDFVSCVIFDGYENRGYPKSLITLFGLKDSSKFTTSNLLNFEIPNLYIKAINYEGISIYAFEPQSVMQKRLFIRVWVSNVNLESTNDWKAQTKVYEKRLKEIAETISLR